MQKDDHNIDNQYQLAVDHDELSNFVLLVSSNKDDKQLSIFEY